MYKKYIKRLFDIVFSFIAILSLSPILILTAILVRIKLGSPVIFKQKRPGKNEKIFTMYKFRTMTDEKDSEGKLLSDEIRLTKFGKILRSTSLDELPELFNILKGDMSFIGPRPLLIKYLPYYRKEERKRHDVRPGITGLAQVNGRNLLNWTDRFKLDVEYSKKTTALNDFKIFIKTIKKVLIKSDIVVGNEHVMENLDDERKDEMENKIEYREIVEQDLNENEKEFKKYILEVMKKNFEGEFSKEVIEIYNNMLKYVRDKTAIIMGGFENEKLVGFIWAYQRCIQNENRLHISYLVVDEKYRGKGIATELINKIIEVGKSKNIVKIELMVTKSNENAIEFYEKNDFYEERVSLCKDI